MKRTLRVLALPAAILLLAACGSNTNTDDGPATDAPAAEAENVDDSDAWPVVEDENGNVVENPEDEPMDGDGAPMDGYEEGDVTDSAGNVTAIEFGDGETLEFDMSAAVGDKPMNPGARVYGLSENGGDFVITTEAEPVAELEEYRERADGDPVSYLSIDVDNREGTENINMYEVAVYDAAGNEYLFEGAEYAVDRWQETFDVSDETADYSDGVDLYNKYVVQGASPHQRSTMTLVGDKLPDEFVTVVAMPSGAFEVSATTPLMN